MVHYVQLLQRVIQNGFIVVLGMYDTYEIYIPPPSLEFFFSKVGTNNNGGGGQKIVHPA